MNKVKILLLIRWSYRSPIMLTIEPRMIRKVLSMQFNLLSTQVLLLLVPKSKPNHTPLKYRGVQIIFVFDLGTSK